MKLNTPVIRFKAECNGQWAKVDRDSEWYRVQGVTKTLGKISGYGKDKKNSTNMITMDLFRRVVADIHRKGGVESVNLEWLVPYLTTLNVPGHDAVRFREALARKIASPGFGAETCRRLWDSLSLSITIGIAVDHQCKLAFNDPSVDNSRLGLVTQLVLAQLEALGLQRVCAGVKVANLPRPDQSSCKPHAYHNGCKLGCRKLRADWGFYTEVDMVAYDPVTDKFVLLELKTRNSDVIDRRTLWRYNTQLWLTQMMFSLTYPSMAYNTTAYLVIVRPGTNHVEIKSCFRPTISRSMKTHFPWLMCLCPLVRDCLTPFCANMRVETTVVRNTCRRRRLFSARRQEPVDVKDLCYRNLKFNEEKREIRRNRILEARRKEAKKKGSALQGFFISPTTKSYISSP